MGEDILADKDRCPSEAQSTEPTVSADGAFAAFASPRHGISGQGLIDMPAWIVVRADDEVRVLPWPVYHSGELEWRPDGGLLFTGTIGWAAGTWTTDGDSLAAISKREPVALSISPDGSRLAALVHVHEIDSIADLERAEEQGYEDELFLRDVVLLEL